MHIQEASSYFEQQLVADGRAPGTVAQRVRHVRAFATWAAGERHGGDIAAVTPHVIARYLGLLSANGAPPARRTANSVRSSLRQFFGYLEALGVVERSPARVLRNAPVPEEAPRPMPTGEARRLRAALSLDASAAARRDRALVELLVGTGLRLSEALGLRVEDTELGRGEARVAPSKGGCARTAFLSDAVVDALRRSLGRRQRGPVFLGRGDAPMTARHAERRFAQWLERAGIEGRWTPHSLRHTFATELYRRTGDIALVKEALGHRSITSTLVYARADECRVREAVLACDHDVT